MWTAFADCCDDFSLRDDTKNYDTLGKLGRLCLRERARADRKVLMNMAKRKFPLRVCFFKILHLHNNEHKKLELNTWSLQELKAFIASTVE